MTEFRKLARALFAPVLLASTLVVSAQAADAASSKSFHVDCAAGNDGSSGTSSAKAWRSINRANSATLGPGDRLLLKRGCSWYGQRLEASWHGTDDANILITGYGNGSKPVIRQGRRYGIQVTGSYQVLRGLEVDFNAEQREPCGQPVGNYYGVNFTEGAHDNLLKNSVVQHATAGVHLSRDSSRNRILDNVIKNNNVAKTWTDTPWRDLGAWGILVLGDENEIGFNTLRDNKAVCINNGFKRMSNSIELFEARDNLIHHNRAYNDRVFSEMGSTEGDVASRNTYSYNLHVTDEPEARFLTTRGPSHDWGPVWDTLVFHNTIHFTGAGSQGVVCGGGCGASVLTLFDNIIWAEEKAVFADGEIGEGGNVFWNTAGEPVVQVPNTAGETDSSRQARNSYLASSTSVAADPQFVNPANQNYRVRGASPAIDLGGRNVDADLGIDLARKALPASVTESGAFEQ